MTSNKTKGPFALWSEWQSQALATQEAQLRAARLGQQWMQQSLTLARQGSELQRAAADAGLRQMRMMNDWMKMWGLK